MAKKGLDYVAFAKYSCLGGTTTYSDGVKLSPAAAFNVTVNSNTSKDYGDNRAVETVSEVTGGTLSVELNDDNANIYSYLLGAEASTETGTEAVFKSNANDDPPLVGAAAIGKTGNKWRLKVYKKCQFSEPNDENTTKQESTTFGHVTLPGELLIPEDGEWRIVKDFSTLAAAITALETMFDIQ